MSARPLFAEDLDLLQALAAQEARESFWAYRQFINPTMKLGWWQKLMAFALQDFYEDFVAGKRPKLVIETPPQHGKSRMIVEFIAWCLGKSPDTKTIYTSFSERLGVRANLYCQRIIGSERHLMVFPVNVTADTYDATAAQPQRNRELVEIAGHEGYFRNTTVGGAITGESLDLGVIDDPIKSREEASSATVREKTWDWFTDDFFTRFSEHGAFLCIGTRWDVDDPIGRIREHFGTDLRVESYPAIATEDEQFRKAGEALFPEHKSLEFLLERKGVLFSGSWEALYQQRPIISGGNIIKGEFFGSYRVLPPIQYRMIYGDTAQKTAERHDYSVFECWGKGVDNKAYLIDLIRGKWMAPELEKRCIAFWDKHNALDSDDYGALRKLKIEDKASGTGLIQKIQRDGSIPIEAVQRNKDKYTRLQDVLGYIESGYVVLPANAPFVNDFVAECEAFSDDDGHKHDDQIDPMMDALTDMLAQRKSIYEVM